MKTSNKPSHLIRLYWGENCVPKSPAVMRALGCAFLEAKNTSHLYPGELQVKTKKALGSAYKIHPNQIMVGAGIEGILKEILPHLLVSRDTLLTLSPTFGVYEHIAHAIGSSVTHIPITLTQQLTADDVLSAVTKKTTLIIIASPNTMTGMYHLKIEEYKKILSSFSGIMIVDECYYHIGNQTILPLLNKYNNLIVLRSASKSWGLAGIRFGFGFGSESLISQLEKHTIAIAPDPLPAISYLALCAVLPQKQRLADAFVSFRNDFAQKLATTSYLKIHATNTTFIPVTVPNAKKIPAFLAAMTSNGILLKDSTHLGYLLIGVPPKVDWPYVLSCFQKNSTLL